MYRYPPCFVFVSHPHKQNSLSNTHRGWEEATNGIHRGVRPPDDPQDMAQYG